MIFRYEAFAADGKPRTGTVEAATPEDATSKIRRDLGLFAMSVEELADGKPIRTILNHEPTSRPDEGSPPPPEPPATPNDVVFHDFLVEAQRLAEAQRPHEVPFSREELRDIRERAQYQQVRHEPLWSWAYADLAIAADYLDLLMERMEREEKLKKFPQG
jgi:hypothetical protein